jgi:uncharacterized membrane protein YsdA (DUF1294 family)
MWESYWTLALAMIFVLSHRKHKSQKQKFHFFLFFIVMQDAGTLWYLQKFL